MLAVGCARRVPAARADGLGSSVAGSVPLPAAALLLIVVLLVAGLVDEWRGVAGVATALGCAALVLGIARVRLGGVTGDVLGALVEVALAGYLVAQVAG
jgi:adenosylcobinamide-GDP ribazoletransferase